MPIQVLDVRDGIEMSELPRHLRFLVNHVERIASGLSEDYTDAELLAVRSELREKLAELTVEDLNLLIRFYELYNVDGEVRSEELIRCGLFTLLGQKDSAQIRERMLGEIEKRLAASNSVD